MRLIVLLCMFVSTAAFAYEYKPASIEFSIRTDDNGKKLPMTCKLAETLAEIRLEQLGAEEIEIRCQGAPTWADPNDGIAWSTTVYAKFLAPVIPENATYRKIIVDAGHASKQNCNFNKNFVYKALTAFTHLKMTKVGKYCRTDDSRWSFEFEMAE